jgi:PAS domain S-box-containing protein
VFDGSDRPHAGFPPATALGTLTHVTSDARILPPDSSDDRFRSLVEHLPVVVFTMTDEVPGRTLYVNERVEAILGYSVADWLADGELWLRILHPDDRDDLIEAWGRARPNRDTWDREFRMRHADGHWVWIHEHTRPVFGDDGEVTCWEGITEDISDRMDAQRAAAEAQGDLIESQARYRSLVENLPAIVYVDTDEPRPRTTYISPNAEAVLGYPAERFLEPDDFWIATVHPEDLPGVLEAWDVSWRTGEAFDMEYRVFHDDGSEIWIHDHTEAAFDGDGGRTHWQGVLVDITDRVRAERELARSEARYQALVEGIPAVVYEMGLDDYRRTLYASPHIEALFGYTRGEWLDQQDIWMELLHPDDREIELAAHDLHSSTGEPWAREYRLIAADGRVVWVRDIAMLLRDALGKPLRWRGVMVDVTALKEGESRLRSSNDELELRVRARTAQLEEANELMSLEIGERRRVEKEHRAAEERFRHLVENLPAVVYRRQVATADDDADHSYASPQIDEVLGFTAADWRDDDVRTSRIHPHDRAAVAQAWARSSVTGEPFQLEYRYLHKDGRVVSVLDRATMLSRNSYGEPCIFQGVLIDLSARVEAERKAEEAEGRFRELVERGPILPYSFTVDRAEERRVEVLYMGPQMAELLGSPRDAWIEPERWGQLMHPDDRDQVLAQLRAHTESGEPWDLDYRVLAADGSIVWVNDRGRCTQRDEAGRPVRFQGAVSDVTARRLAEDALASEHALLRQLVDGMPAIPWSHVVDPDSGWTRYLFMGKQCFELTGYTAEELIAEPNHFSRMVHPDDIERVSRKNDEADRTGVWDDEYRLIHRDGSIRWIHGVGRRMTPPGVDPVTWHGVTIDVTARHLGDGTTIADTLEGRVDFS